MGGFFLDSLVVGIAHMVHESTVAAKPYGGVTADGKIVRFTTSYGSPTLPLVDYTFVVNGQEL